MRAMVTPKFGGSELFEERDDVERPVPGPGQVLVRVLATAGIDNQQTLKALGVDVAIDYTRNDVTETALDDTAGAGVDAVFDTVGGDTVVNSIPATRPYVRIATILGGQGGLCSPLPEGPGPLQCPPRERARLDEMSRLIERGQTKPLVDEVLTLDKVGKAHERLEFGHGRGKIVLRAA